MSIESARKIVYARSQGRCEAGIRGWCEFGRAGNWHHRRSAGRIWTPANGLHLCGSGTTGCHGWITEHPELARSNGWIVSNYVNPDLVHLVPVLVRDWNQHDAQREVLLHPYESRYLDVAPGLRGCTR